MSKSGVEHSPGVAAVLFLPTNSFCCVKLKHMKFNRLWAQIFAKKVLFTQDFVCDLDSVVELTMEDRLFIEKLSGPENWAMWKFQMEHLRTMGHMVVETDNVPEGANAELKNGKKSVFPIIFSI